MLECESLESGCDRKMYANHNSCNKKAITCIYSAKAIALNYEELAKMPIFQPCDIPEKTGSNSLARTDDTGL